MPELSATVRDHRRAALARVMDRAGVPALLLAGSDWFEHATNHPLAVQAWERPHLLVLARDGRAAAVLPDIARNRIDAQRARGTLWLDEVAYYSEQPRQSGRRRLVHQMPELAAEVVDGMGLARARIGVDAAGGPAGRVAALLPELRLVPTLRWLRDARLVKHPDEIATMRAAAAIADHALARDAEGIRRGRLLQELVHA
ncbi:MAG: aminopeptidase P family protein, partial [Alphaproteobacteria bacterium]